MGIVRGYVQVILAFAEPLATCLNWIWPLATAIFVAKSASIYFQLLPSYLVKPWTPTKLSASVNKGYHANKGINPETKEPFKTPQEAYNLLLKEKNKS